MELWREFREYLKDFYQENEHPALSHQLREWEKTRPLEGKSVLDATPVFRNTINKYVNLLAAGARLTIGIGGNIPHDPAIVEWLGTHGIRVANREDRLDEFDFVLDCAGAHRHRKSRLGYVELTRSGAYYYKDCPQPVFVADDSRIKLLETMLGTGDGFRRGLKNFGYPNFQNKNILIFGCGKVGRGVALAARAEGGCVTVVDDCGKILPPEGIPMIDRNDRAALEEAIRHSWCVVTVTGIRHALQNSFDPAVLINSKALAVCMGVEDEFGSAIPPERVLNRKAPLNFVLPEPTRLCYIDPTMALHNEGAVQLLSGKLKPGLNATPTELDENFLTIVRKNGILREELKWLPCC